MENEIVSLSPGLQNYPWRSNSVYKKMFILRTFQIRFYLFIFSGFHSQKWNIIWSSVTFYEKKNFENIWGNSKEDNAWVLSKWEISRKINLKEMLWHQREYFITTSWYVIKMKYFNFKWPSHLGNQKAQLCGRPQCAMGNERQITHSPTFSNIRRSLNCSPTKAGCFPRTPKPQSFVQRSIPFMDACQIALVMSLVSSYQKWFKNNDSYALDLCPVAVLFQEANWISTYYTILQSFQWSYKEVGNDQTGKWKIRGVKELGQQPISQG
jgi:hypothetical protein